MRALDYGGIIMSLLTPDRAGRFANIVLGYDTEEKYLDNRRYFGAIIGRYANRIARGRFSLDGNVYQLATNQGTNHLHGGIKGFDKVVWSAETFRTSGSEGVAFSYTSRDGEEGYPGTLRVRVIYTLTDTNDLIVEYEATTDKPTVINLTQHTYFNLTGGVQDILDHELTIEADRFTPTDAMQIPTGEIVAVRGTAFDFTQRTRIGARIDGVHEQLVAAGGYDHNWVLRGSGGLAAAARVVEPKSGRTVEVSTTQPGVQFYAGNRLDRPRSGFCLETQHFPDSPNQPSFPSTILRPAETFRSKTVFAFGIDR